MYWPHANGADGNAIGPDADSPAITCGNRYAVADSDRRDGHALCHAYIHGHRYTYTYAYTYAYANSNADAYIHTHPVARRKVAAGPHLLRARGLRGRH
jgi:hypothetical protein